jgi:hypothetical protein
MDRALHRAEAVFQLSEARRKERKYGPWTDPACIQGIYPALQGEPDRWNSAILKTQRNRDKNPHKAPNKRAKGAPLQWVLLGVTASLRIMRRCCPHPIWDALWLQVSSGEPEKALEHVTAYIHMRCSFSTDFSVFSISSHMASNRLRRQGRSYPSSFCMVRAADLVPVAPGVCLLDDIPDIQDQTLLPVYVMYFSRLEWHSGAKMGDAITADTRFAYALLLPATMQTVHGHKLFRYERADLKMANTACHVLVPIDSIDRPLIVDRSEDSTVTLIHFLGKGLEQVLEDDCEGEGHIDVFDWDDLSDVAE